MKNNITQYLAIFWAAAISSTVCFAQNPDASVKALHRDGTEAFRRGDFTGSIDLWKEARELAERGDRTRTEVSILVNLAQAYQGIGNPALAFHSLDAAETVAAELGDEALLLKIRGVRGGAAALGDDGRFRDIPAVSPGGNDGARSAGRAWTLAELEKLLAFFESPAFGKPSPAELRAANEYFREHATTGLRSGLLAVLQGEFDERLETIDGYIEQADSRAFSRLKRTKSWLDDEQAQGKRGREVAEMYRKLSGRFEGLVAKNIITDPDDKKTVLALVEETTGNAAAIDQSLGGTTTLLADAGTGGGAPGGKLLRSGSTWGGLLASADGRVLSARDREMMRTLAKGSLPDLVERAHSHLETLEPVERIDAEAGRKALARADKLAGNLLKPELALNIKLGYGAWMAFAGGTGEAAAKPEQQLLAAWAGARQAGDTALEAAFLNDLGVSLSSRGNPGLTGLCFDRAVRQAGQAGDDELAARSLVNRAKASGEDADFAGAAAKVTALPATHAKSLMLLSLGESYAGRQDSASAYPLYKEALEIGRANEDSYVRCYALGMLGDLYLTQNRFDDALSLTRRALFLAQGESLRSKDLVFRWTWQSGRALEKKGLSAKALDAYTRAEKVLTSIRQDLVLVYGRRGEGAKFRDEIGPFYFELSDLYFNRARSVPGGSREDLLQARSAVERFKAALLEDYFRDRSITTFRQAGIGGDAAQIPKRPAGEVARRSAVRTAVIYLIPMESKTEMLLELDGELLWETADAGRKSLESAADDLRFSLDPIVSKGAEGEAHLEPARRLYDQLIRPFRKRLDDEKVETLVIVPDGKLRSVPMGVLHDGDRYLIERFSLAIVPDLSLIPDDRKRKSRRSGDEAKPLVLGLSLPVRGFSPLPGVVGEVDRVVENFDQKAPTLLMNEEFTKSAFAASFRDDFDLIHIASHANFSTELEDTFVLTYEENIGPQDLEKSVRKLVFRERAVDLIVLSACETAVGDDRAALGLAGIAVKSGAHSVMASLWSVDDESTRELITSFYEKFLPKEPGLSKAQALREAQLRILRNRDHPEWKHPRYWAPFTVIGNWLAPEERLRIDEELRESES